MKERRKHERFALGLPSEIEVSNSPMQRVLHCVTANASAGGAFFPTAEPIAERTRARIRMLLNNERVEALTGLKAQAWIEGTVLRASPRGFAVSFEDKYRITPVRSQ